MHNTRYVEDAATPEAMRAVIYKLKFDIPLVRSVMDMADYNGLSAEDRYTMLAYHAVKESVRLRDMLLEQINTTPDKPILVPNEGVRT